MDLIVNGNRGIYAPQAFCQIIFSGFKEIPLQVHADDVRIVKEGPTHEEYYEAWERIVDDYEDEEGNIIYEDQHIWLCKPEELNKLKSL